MPYDEYLTWQKYFDKRPPGWQEDDRAFKFIQTQGFKGKPWEIFPNLLKIYRPTKKHSETLNIGDLKGSFLFQQMLSAQNGEKLAILEDV
jgi:hypothetical protein